MQVHPAPVLLPRRRAAGLAVGGLAAVAVVGLLDPNQPGHYPTCPSRLLFHVDCPFCGGLRGVHDLLHGHGRAALDHNLLLLVIVPLLAWLWISWAARALGHDVPPPTVPRWLLLTGIGVAVTFTVIRNLALPGLQWLDAA